MDRKKIINGSNGIKATVHDGLGSILQDHQRFVLRGNDIQPMSIHYMINNNVLNTDDQMAMEQFAMRFFVIEDATEKKKYLAKFEVDEKNGGLNILLVNWAASNPAVTQMMGLPPKVTMLTGRRTVINLNCGIDIAFELIIESTDSDNVVIVDVNIWTMPHIEPEQIKTDVKAPEDEPAAKVEEPTMPEEAPVEEVTAATV